jgi:hypothetical protein
MTTKEEETTITFTASVFKGLKLSTKTLGAVLAYPSLAYPSDVAYTTGISIQIPLSGNSH